MGGMGSGRHYQRNARDTVEQYRSIDVRRWARDGLLEPGRYFGWQWTRDGERLSDIGVKAEEGSLRLIYRFQSRGAEWESMDYAVRLLEQPCNLGGFRQWFACPAFGCGRRVALLYGGRVFACRHCYRLAYPSTREKRFERNQRRADRIRARLGWETGFDSLPGPKPKGMHWRTFNRLSADLDSWETLQEEAFTQRLSEWAERLGMDAASI